MEKDITLKLKLRLMHALVKSIYLYACQSLTREENSGLGNARLLKNSGHKLQRTYEQQGSTQHH